MIGALRETFGELYRSRSLVAALVRRHLAVRYRGSVLGLLWTVLNPLLLMAVYVLVFRYYVRFSEVDNYPVYVFCGLLPWIWFTSAVSEGTTSIVSGGHLITKSMFPAHVLPVVAALTTGVNFLLSLPVLALVMLVTGAAIPWSAVFLPLLLLIQVVFVAGLGVLFGSLNVIYRDVQHLIGHALTFLFFLCPILYPPHVVPSEFRYTLVLNPLAAMTSLYHQVLIDGTAPGAHELMVVVIGASLAVLAGVWVYRRNHEVFAELL